MSRQFRMERIVSERDGQNIFQGSAINPKTGCNSAIFLSSDDDLYEDEESNGSEGLVEPAEESTPYALQMRPVSRKSARFSNDSHNVKVQNWIKNKTDEDSEQKSNLPTKPLKQKKKKEGNAKSKGSQGKKSKSKKETIIPETLSDEDKIIEGTRNLMSQVEKKFTVLENEKNSRYKRLLQELNIFVSQHEKELIGRGNSINLEPVNVNMSEFHDWLDNVEKGKFNKNEVSDKYKMDNMFSDIFEKTGKTIKRKQSKKILRIKKSSHKGENDKDVSLEVLNEEVLNSWRSGLEKEDDYDESVIRVRPLDKKDKNYLLK